MHKNMLRVAVSAALLSLTFGAQAANVEVYGLIDTGLNFQHVDTDLPGEDA